MRTNYSIIFFILVLIIKKSFTDSQENILDYDSSKEILLTTVTQPKKLNKLDFKKFNFLYFFYFCTHSFQTIFQSVDPEVDFY